MVLSATLRGPMGTGRAKLQAAPKHLPEYPYKQKEINRAWACPREPASPETMTPPTPILSLRDTNYQMQA